MKIRIVSASCCLAVAGCSSVPTLPSGPGVSPKAIAQRIECELAGIAQKTPAERAWFKTWGAGYTLTLRVDESGTVAPTAAALVGLAGGAGGDLFGTGLSLSASSASKRLATLTYRLTMKDAAKRESCKSNDGTGLEGDLKIAEWLDSAIGAFENGKQGRHPATIGYTVEFVVTKSARASADFTLLPVRAPGSFGLGLGASAQRTDTQILDIAFADVAQPQPQEVYVVNMPAPGKAISGGPPSDGSAPLPARRPAGLTIPQPVPWPDAIDRQLEQLLRRNDR
ncbi:hypothetical protein [uncultured Alsobacter sp.]|uniref:hypothetical protein n=1 Tax=uncultured Alsobacter sp. TaxID=1748258 RepID=UPI0025D69CF7|nr:hypothetical protein [uncultured Alsobacter sp.]